MGFHRVILFGDNDLLSICEKGIFPSAHKDLRFLALKSSRCKTIDNEKAIAFVNEPVHQRN